MRNLKFIYVLSLFVFLFGCTDSEMTRDTTPEVVSPESTFGPVEDDPDPVPDPVTTIVIAVQYPDGYKRGEFESYLGPLINLVSIETCLFDPAIDLWTVEAMHYREILRILQEHFPGLEIQKEEGAHSNSTGGHEGYETYEILIPSSSDSENAPRPWEPTILVEEIEPIGNDPDPQRGIIIYFDGQCRRVTQ